MSKKKYSQDHYGGPTVEVTLTIATTSENLESARKLMEACFIEANGLSRWDLSLQVMEVNDVKVVDDLIIL